MVLVYEVQKSGHCLMSTSCSFSHHIDGDGEVQIGVETCPVLMIGVPVAELQTAISVRALCYFPSLGPSSAGSLAGQGLGEQAQGSYKASWLAGWLDRKQL